MAPSTRDRVLVVGSCHLDIFADQITGRALSPAQVRKRRGQITIAAGGTGFNIAVCLSTNGQSCSITTRMHPKYVGHDIISQELDYCGVRNLIRTDEQAEHYFFIAQRTRGRGGMSIQTAICNDGLIDVRFPEDEIRGDIAHHEYVVLCCNYPQSEIRKIFQICKDLSKPLIISGVGEEVVVRLRELEKMDLGEYVARLLCLDLTEAIALTGADIDTRQVANKPEIVEQLACSIARGFPFQAVCITRGEYGYSVASKDGRCRHFSAPYVGVVQSNTGAGDATLAGLTICIVRGLPLTEGDDFDEMKAIVARCVGPVLTNTHANASRAYVRSEQLKSLKGLELPEERQRRRELMINALLAIGGAVLGYLLSVLSPHLF